MIVHGNYSWPQNDAENIQQNEVPMIPTSNINSSHLYPFNHSGPQQYMPQFNQQNIFIPGPLHHLPPTQFEENHVNPDNIINQSNLNVFAQEFVPKSGKESWLGQSPSIQHTIFTPDPRQNLVIGNEPNSVPSPSEYFLNTAAHLADFPDHQNEAVHESTEESELEHLSLTLEPDETHSINRRELDTFKTIIPTEIYNDHNYPNLPQSYAMDYSNVIHDPSNSTENIDDKRSAECVSEISRDDRKSTEDWNTDYTGNANQKHDNTNIFQEQSNISPEECKSTYQEKVTFSKNQHNHVSQGKRDYSSKNNENYENTDKKSTRHRINDKWQNKSNSVEWNHYYTKGTKPDGVKENEHKKGNYVEGHSSGFPQEKHIRNERNNENRRNQRDRFKESSPHIDHKDYQKPFRREKTPEIRQNGNEDIADQNLCTGNKGSIEKKETRQRTHEMKPHKEYIEGRQNQYGHDKKKEYVKKDYSQRESGEFPTKNFFPRHFSKIVDEETSEGNTHTIFNNNSEDRFPQHRNKDKNLSKRNFRPTRGDQFRDSQNSYQSKALIHARNDDEYKRKSSVSDSVDSIKSLEDQKLEKENVKTFVLSQKGKGIVYNDQKHESEPSYSTESTAFNEEEFNKQRHKRQSFDKKHIREEHAPPNEDKKRYRDLRQERESPKPVRPLQTYDDKYKRSSLGKYEDQNIEDLFDRHYEKYDEEYKEFLTEITNNVKCTSVKIVEQEQDLFEVPGTYSLAHCVAEDLRMGSGVAVSFKTKYKCVEELLQQGQKPGGLALLSRKNIHSGQRHYVYYLVTKRRSRDKPTYKDFWCSVKKLRDHIVENKVKKIAIPKLGCGLDKLDWSTVKHIIEFLFRNVDIEILYCKFSQALYEESPQKSVQSFKVYYCHDKLVDVEEKTIILYFCSTDNHVTSEMDDLEERFKFLNHFTTAEKDFGAVVKYKTNDRVLCGCIVKKESSAPFDFRSFKRCIDKLNQIAQEDEYTGIAMPYLKEDTDELLHDKILTLLIHYLKDINVYVYSQDTNISLEET